jgi:hypothetical protein
MSAGRRGIGGVLLEASPDAGWRRWRDLGLRGLDVEGRVDAGFPGRNEQRDVAFAEGLYGTGLRLAEWASVRVCELPDDDPGRNFSTRWLANACAKGGYGHKYWIPRPTLLEVLSYLEGARARVVRRAQREGRYERLDRVRLILDVQREHLVVLEPDGRQTRPTMTRSAQPCGAGCSAGPRRAWSRWRCG